MKISIIVQARMKSTRLPGKIMKTVLGKPLLEYQLERLKRVTLADEVVIATTQDRSDDVIVALCERLSIPFFRGDTEDVLDRYYRTVKQRGADVVVRITSDCPLIDPQVIDAAIRLFNIQRGYDYISNVVQRTYPRGMDCEVFPFSLLEKIHRDATHAADREHVTLFVRLRPHLFHLGHLLYQTDESYYRWTIDAEDDFKLIREFFEHFYPQNPAFSLEDCLELVKRKPALSKLNEHVQQKEI